MKTHWILLLSLVLMSCGSSFQSVIEQPPSISTPSSQEISTQGSALNITTTPPGKDQVVDLAKQDLANHLKIDPNQIDLLQTMEIKSAVIAEGCTPGSGQIITQGDKVYGYRIWLQTAGEKYIYHAGLTGQVFFCPITNPGVNNPLLATPDGTIQNPQNQFP